MPMLHNMAQASPRLWTDDAARARPRRRTAVGAVFAAVVLLLGIGLLTSVWRAIAERLIGVRG